LVASRQICVAAERLTYRYSGSDQNILDDLSLQVETGECIALMGPNGCGKSTLAKLLAGLIPPSSGSLTVLNADLTTPTGRADIRGKVGIVLQSPDEGSVATTVEREIAFGPENLSRPPDEIRDTVDELLDRFDLRKYSERSPHLLSGGEKQRLALASVLAMRPGLLILDEVTSLLDPRNRTAVLEQIRGLKRSITLIFITQFPEETRVADRLLVMKDGTIVHGDSPDRLLRSSELVESLNIHPPAVFTLMNAAECAANPRKK